jgi:hypothetical protein
MRDALCALEPRAFFFKTREPETMGIEAIAILKSRW